MKKNFTLVALFVFFVSQLAKAQAPADTVGAGRALLFSGGQSSYVDLGDSYNSLTFPFSFEAWVYCSAVAPLRGTVFATDNDPNYYCGVDIGQTNAGLLDVQFSDDSGGGSGNRRGIETQNTLPLNRWTHLAVVCTSVTNVSIYFNGVLQNTQADNGTSPITSITHSAGHASIGEYYGINFQDAFIGQIDEVRLWNTALAQNTIQADMCKKLYNTTSGLIGYWRADESDTANTITDYSSSGIKGTLQSSVVRVISGAPVGNSSTYLYTPDYTGALLKVGVNSGDSLIINQISGTPAGVQVYGVNASPYIIAGLKSSSTSYFGVFCINGTSPSYSLAYHYSLSDGVVNSFNQDSAALSKRIGAGSVPWSITFGSLSTSQKIISETGLSYPQQEYTLNVPAISGIDPLSIENGKMLIYPNPSSGLINVAASKNIDDIKVTNMLGQLIYESHPKQTQVAFELNGGGLYFVSLTSNNKTITSKVVITK